MVHTGSTLQSGLDRVPPFPAVATKLLNLLNNQDINSSAVAELIESDAALTARLLQHANSALCGGARSITDVQHAISRLGFDDTRQLIVTTATAAYARHAPNNGELQRCWRHSLATAVIGEAISKRSGIYSGAVFTAGVLHDIGRLGLMLAFPTQYGRAIRQASGRPMNLLAFERTEFGLEHTEAGSLLIEAWNLPAEFRHVAAYHHGDRLLGDPSLLGIIHLACGLADALGFGLLAPRGDEDFAALMGALPSRQRERLSSDPEYYRELVYEHIQKVVSPS